ncbi:class I SAM-dependent methyltransferase [Streptomyces sp. NPDC002812]|uniref:class I SAM-dependent methyltransferase n=1 Tax=Streptomyces TaxID=1883 RepID=UPI002257FC5C|nr:MULTISPECIES: class I SAM-dependent methyltransferase [unclassified Streptomyces]MCX5126552.1 class I SAM-dependent methyltransferase [Streptomyces sp. NBC_00347]MCX5300186.1 class I SAM-dependent methyltransferase [Streptomyces sp. NBC_00193]
MRQQYDTTSTPPPAFSVADAFTLRTALDALGGVRGLDTLDMACGHGSTTRMLASGGARRTVGVDSCPERIRRARETGADLAHAVEYVVADAAAGMPALGPFDLATAVYLFNQAHDRTALHAMFRAVRANLRPGGRLLAIVPNPGAFPYADWAPYGISVVERSPGGDAPLLRARLETDPPVPFECREWAHADFAEAAADAGFATVTWQPTRTPPACETRDETYWARYRTAPVGSLMNCVA